jgi:quaternary ammonium compound-resistance protein SugE
MEIILAKEYYFFLIEERRYMNMAWFYLVLAGLTEIIWAIGLKFSEGFTDPFPSVVTAVFIVISFLLFAKAMSMVPIGTAYAVFTGIGAAGTAVLGVLLFDENASLGKMAFLFLLLVGIIGLKVTDGKSPEQKEADS